MLPDAVADRLARLAPDQRAAATAPPGPVLCVAPAGSGKTTTLVARIAWLVATGVDPASITAVTFNKRAADELNARVATALEPLGLAAGTVRVRTFHALGREILADAGEAVEPLLDREAVLRDVFPGIERALIRRLDDAFSRLKLDICVTAEEVARDPMPGAVARAFLAYERAIDDAGGLDFDDLLVRSVRLLEARPRLLERWRGQCAHLLVDETQDVDRTQLRLALLLAAPADAVFLVGDDDQTIYGWRLADVRRVLGLAASLPGLRRVDLTVNYRCPRPVVDRAVRLVSRNRERFAKQIAAGPKATGRLLLRADGADETVRIGRVVDAWAEARSQGTHAILARTNAELLPAAAVAVERGMTFFAPKLRLLSEDRRLDAMLEAVRAGLRAGECPLPALAAFAARCEETEPLPEARPRVAPAPARDADVAVREDRRRDGDEPLPVSERALASALVAWAAPFATIDDVVAALEAHRARVAALRRDSEAEARLTLATAHATKGLEFDHVAVIGMDDGRFPSARSLRDSVEPERALEEERRLAYVAWTRARRSLTLVYDPAAPSRFLLEAFEPAELHLEEA